MVGIVGFGGYLPRLRVPRKAIAEAHAWMNPALKAKGRGERALANWDEDAVTLAVEAGRDCLGPDADTDRVGAVTLASTSLPFADRLNASIAASALGLPRDVAAADMASTARAGVTALIQAMRAAPALGGKTALVLAGEERDARAASAQEFDYGDGGAAFEIGTENVAAAFLGAHTVTADFVDRFRGATERFDYGWEERWIRDEGYAKLVPEAAAGALAAAGVEAADLAHIVLPCPFPGVPQKLMAKLGADPDKVRDTLAATVGDTGAAHPLLMLALCLEEAKPGEKILIVQFGQGAEALVLEVTEAIARARPAHGVSAWLARRTEEPNYMKMATFKGLIEWERGMRAEKDNKTALSVLYRKDDLITGFTGGKCSQCGTIQIPRTRLCVNPNCKAADTQEPIRMADLTGRILSWSADYLTYSLSPPAHYGMVTFEDGGRLMVDFTDVDPGTVDSGQEVRMAFRVKEFDEVRGFRRYFWKAVPAAAVPQAAE